MKRKSPNGSALETSNYKNERFFQYMAAGEHQVPDVSGSGKFARLYFEFQEMQEGKNVF